MRIGKNKTIMTSDADVSHMYSEYRASRAKKILALIVLIAVLLLASIYGLSVGS